MKTRSMKHAYHKTRARLVTVSIATFAAAALTLASCSSNNAPEPGASDADGSGGTVKIGMINTFDQGAQSESADDHWDGAELGLKYVEEHGGLYNGAKIEIVKGVENGQPALVATTVRKMLTDDIKLIMGPALSADCLAAAPLIDQAGAVSLIGCTTTSITGRDRVGKNLYRFDTNDRLTSTALALQVIKEIPEIDIVDVVAYDYVQGHEGWETFKKVMGENGITFKTDNEFFVPATTTNYAAQVGALAQTPKDGKKRALVLLTWGSGYLNFIQQAMPLKVLDNYEAILTTSMYYKSAIALDGAAPRVYNSYGTCNANMWENDIMDWLKKEMEAKHNRLPDDWSVMGFNNVLVMAAAINEAKSTDSAKVNEAMSTLTVDLVQGTQTMNPETHQVERRTPVCESIGDPDAPEGVKLLSNSIFTPEETGQK